jgi:hypothetical protein
MGEQDPIIELKAALISVIVRHTMRRGLSDTTVRAVLRAFADDPTWSWDRPSGPPRPQASEEGR